MQQLADRIHGFVQSMPEEDDARPDHEQALQRAAEEWATWCLRCFRDDLLKKGLAISTAMADFLSELELKPNARTDSPLP
jgi:hypothetical protein